MYRPFHATEGMGPEIGVCNGPAGKNKSKTVETIYRNDVNRTNAAVVDETSRGSFSLAVSETMRQ